MKTSSQKFTSIIKESASFVLQENGFKKKGPNYFRPSAGLSHTFNIQKDKWNSKEEIKFTFNVGVFSNKYWLTAFDYDQTNEIPKFPVESVSIVRERIGDLKYGKDHWYTIEPQRMVWGLIKEITNDLNNYVLPFLNSITNNTELIDYLKGKQNIHGNSYKLFVILAEEGLFNEAEKVLNSLVLKANNMKEKELLIKQWENIKNKRY